MSLIEKLHGMMVPLITPLTPDEELDEQALRKCIKHVIDGGVNGVFVHSTTGEGPCLLDHVREKAIEITAEETKGKTLFMVGVNDTSTKRVLKNLKNIERYQPDAFVVHPPFFFSLNSQQELLTFYRTLTEATDLPIILYNIPGLTKQPLSIDTVRELLKNPKIIAIKDSSVDYLFLLELIKLKKDFPTFRIFVGKTHLFTPCLLAGGDGGVDGISNLIPERCVRLVELIKAGKIIEAYRQQDEINEIWNVYHVRSFVAGIKMAMHLAGLCGPTVSSPVLTLSEAEKEHVRAIMERYKLLA